MTNSLLYPHRHKVPLPLPSFKEELHEASEHLGRLFQIPTDPFQKLRGHPWKTKVTKTIGWLFPCVEWLTTYKREYFGRDLLAGLTAWSLVPEDLGYAQLANLPPSYGLFSSFLAPVAYAILGTSRHLCVGPTPMISLLLGSLCSRWYHPYNQQEQYISLVVGSTFCAGLILTGLGVLRMGFIADLLSHAAILGFLAGSSIICIFVELGNFLGYTSSLPDYNLQDIFQFLIDYSSEFNWHAFLIGICFFSFLSTLKYLDWKFQNQRPLGTIFHWARVLGPLVSMVLATFFVFITKANLAPANVPTVQEVDGRWSDMVNRNISLDAQDTGIAFGIGAIVGLTAFTEMVAISRTFAAAKGYQVIANKEMIATGAVNLVSSLTNGMALGASFPRSALAYEVGASTQVFGLVLSIGVLLYIVALEKVFIYVPSAALAAVVIDAVLNLIRIPSIIHIWRTDKTDLLVFLATFFSILFMNVEWGFVTAVVAGLLKLMIPISRPHIDELGEVPGTGVYRAVSQYAGTEEVEGVLVLSFNGPLVFSNAGYLREVTSAMVEEKSASSESRIKLLALDFTTVSDVDTTGIHSLFELAKTISDVEVAICNPSKRVLRKLGASRFLDVNGHDKVFLSVHEAVQSFCYSQQNASFEASVANSIRADSRSQGDLS